MTFRDTFWAVVDWLYPPKCAGCGAEGVFLCDECRSKLKPTGRRICPKCGKPLGKRRYCPLCARNDFLFETARAPYVYGGAIGVLIRDLKYNGNLEISSVLGMMLAEFWPSLGRNVDLILPVPLSDSRVRQRGFNQSERIAKDLSRRIGIPCRPRALQKTRETKTQVGLNMEERRENLYGAFAAEPCLVRGLDVLLIDDVMTTGSTFSECSGVLLDAGARSVICLSAATAALRYGINRAVDTSL